MKKIKPMKRRIIMKLKRVMAGILCAGMATVAGL